MKDKIIITNVEMNNVLGADNYIVTLENGSTAYVPNDEGNTDYWTVQEWLAQNS